MILTTAAACYLACAGLLGGAATTAPEHDPFTGADPVLHFSFESDQDLDYDKQPDDWIQRKGPRFPTYVETGIDRTRGHHGRQSLKFEVNGGQAVVYSDLQQIDALHSYVFEGYIRTQLLVHDAALLSVSFLNHKRQRVQRFLSRPVTGNHQGWERVRIGPVAPKKDVQFVVIGCHLVQGKKMDIRGAAWFDNLRLGKLPQLKLVSNFDVHFKQRDAPIKITSNVSGLDPGREYQLHLQLIDSNDQIIDETTRQLKADASKKDETRPDEAPPARPPELWDLGSQEYGYYRVRSRLQRDKVVILDQQTSFAVIDLVEPRSVGEFGWTIAHGAGTMPMKELPHVAAQAGINWLKYPLWQAAHAENQEQSTALGEMLEDLQRRGITPVGLLNDPPAELRSKFAKDWMGISEIFTMPPSFWSNSMDKVIARHSSNVRHWQLGGEDDASFVGMRRLGQTLSTVKRAFDRIGRDTQIGVHWEWETQIPSRAQMPRTFLSISSKPDPDEPHKRLTSPEIIEKLQESQRSGLSRWVLLKPLARSKYTQEERGSDLVKRIVAAKIGGAEAIFASDVFDSEHGLLHPNGSPTLLFLPWRSTATALQGAQYLGSFNMPEGSQNHAFARSGEVVLIAWSEEEEVTEEIYLGEKVTIVDVWGRRQTAPKVPGTSRQRITVGPIPLIIHGCSEAVARWRMAVRFQKGRLRSETAEQEEAILGVNAFPQGVSGQVTLNLPDKWKVDRSSWQLAMGPGERFTLPMLLTLPANASLGTDELSIDFNIGEHQFRVYRPYQVGLGDVVLQVIDRKDEEDGRLKIEQIISNRTSPVEILNFRCSLFVQGHKRQKRIVVKLGEGEDHQFYFVPNAEKLRGQEVWLRAEQIQGPRVLNYKWVLGKHWDEQQADSASGSKPPAAGSRPKGQETKPQSPTASEDENRNRRRPYRTGLRDR